MIDDPAAIKRTPLGRGEPGRRTGLASGVGWNLAALAVLAIAGLALNIVIGRWYGPDVLGAFNIAFAIYIFLSQIAVFGLHLSALQTVATADMSDRSAFSALVLGGAGACAIVALAVAVAALAATPLLGRIFTAVPDLPQAWLYAAPGLLPFALNKYLLGVINGMQHMRAFAIFQALRFVFILALLVVLGGVGAPGAALTLVLSASEAMLLVLTGGYVARQIGGASKEDVVRAARRHLQFGGRVLPAGLVAELNTRVDVLMLGFYLGDRAAGVYTIAALIYETALQAVVVLRNNINPGLARAISEGAADDILRQSRLIALGMTTLMIVGATAAYLLFPMVAEFLFQNRDFEGARAPLFWLLLSLPIAAAPLCYGLILSQGARPGWQSVATVGALAFNVMANAILIPQFGIVGAAMAMGLSGIVMGFLCVGLARTVLGVRLFI